MDADNIQLKLKGNEIIKHIKNNKYFYTLIVFLFFLLTILGFLYFTVMEEYQEFFHQSQINEKKIEYIKSLKVDDNISILLNYNLKNEKKDIENNKTYYYPYFYINKNDLNITSINNIKSHLKTQEKYKYIEYLNLPEMLLFPNLLNKNEKLYQFLEKDLIEKKIKINQTLLNKTQNKNIKELLTKINELYNKEIILINQVVEKETYFNILFENKITKEEINKILYNIVDLNLKIELLYLELYYINSPEVNNI